MPSLSRRLKLLGRCGPATAASALIGAIPRAHPDERLELFRAAVMTGQAAALAAVIRHLHRLGDDAVTVAAEMDGPLDRAIEIVLTRPSRTVVGNVLAVVEARREPMLAAHLPAMLDLDVVPANRVGPALLDLTISVVGETGRREGRPDARAAVEAAVAAALARHRRHRCDRILLAAALLLARGSARLEALLGPDDTALAGALRGVVDGGDDAIVRRNLVRWLADGRLGRAAARWMHEVEGVDGYGDLLRDGHLLLAPSRRRMLGLAARPLRCAPTAALAIALEPAAQRRLADLVDRLDLTARTRLSRLADLVALPDGPARLRALWTLTGRLGTKVDESIAAFAHDRDACVARVAAGRVLAEAVRADRAVTDDEVVVALAASGHERVRRRAQRRLAEASGAEMIRWLGPGGSLRGAERWAAARRAYARDPDGVRRALHTALLLGDGSARADAIAIARRLRLVPLVERTLDDVVREAEPRVAASAVSALADGRGPERLLTLRFALDHDDRRVRANALETLGRVDAPEAAGRAGAFLASDDNRLRANAVLVRHRAEGLDDDLASMLADGRPLHRVSAIWVAKTAGSRDVLRAVEGLAAGDPHPEIRVRARAAASFLAARGDTRRPDDGRSWPRPSARAAGIEPEVIT